MDLGLQNKRALVCASSKGLGRAIAKELAAAGVELVLCSRDKASLDKTAEDIGSEFANVVHTIQADLSQANDRQNLLREVTKLGGVDILVINSGGPPAGTFEQHDADAWQTSFNLLLASGVELIQGVLPAMKEAGWGRIIAVTSLSVKEPVAGLILSNSLRSAVTGMIKTLSAEVAEAGITANCVLPGYTETDRMVQLSASNPQFSKVIDAIPMKRMAQPEEFAAAVAFLASQRASYITGISLPVDGGALKALL